MLILKYVGCQLCKEEPRRIVCLSKGDLHFKLTNTFDAISNPAFSAATLEASWDV